MSGMRPKPGAKRTVAMTGVDRLSSRCHPPSRLLPGERKIVRYGSGYDGGS